MVTIDSYNLRAPGMSNRFKEWNNVIIRDYHPPDVAVEVISLLKGVKDLQKKNNNNDSELWK